MPQLSSTSSMTLRPRLGPNHLSETDERSALLRDAARKWQRENITETYGYFEWGQR